MDLFPTAMDEKNSTESSNTPTPTTSLNNSDDVIEHIRNWIQLDAKPKMHENAIQHIESFVDRKISCLESTLVERQYVKVVLEMWLRKGLRKAVGYLNDETIDISVEMPTLLEELNSINSFEDIGLKLNEATCQLTNLCKAGCQYLQLILNQVDLFKNTPRFSVLVSSYFKQFKEFCIGKVFSRCLDDVTKDQINDKRNCEFIVAQNVLLKVATEDLGIQNALEEYFTGKDVKDFDGANGQDLITQLMEIFASCCDTTVNESSTWLNQQKSEKEWTPKLQILVKETCKAFLLPKTTIKVKDKYGRKIIFIKGVSVFVNKIIDEMKRLKEKNPEVQEIQIVGLSSVHVDCHLENEIWYGTNVGIVADRIFIDYEDCRNGHKYNFKAKEPTEPMEAHNFFGDFAVCWDVSGKNGEPRGPGTSGGNVHIICNEMFNANRWKVISDGGKGGDGQNGSSGERQREEETHKWSKEYFNQVFPSMSTFGKGEQTKDTVSNDAVKRVLTALSELLPIENRISGKDVQPDNPGNFFVKGTAKDGSKITVSYYQSKTKRHTLIFCQGSSVGQGGYGGTITFEFIIGKDSFAMESRVPVVGKDNRQPRTVRMGVYQAKGSDGVTGIPVGDVGFIHRLDTSEASANQNLTGQYIGFENDVSLRMESSRTKPKRQPNDSDNYYAKRWKGEYASIAYHGLSAYGSIQPLQSTVENATKQKAIVRQSLTQHVIQVDERKQMLQFLQARLSSNWGEEKFTDNVDLLVSQMRDKETQLHQLTLQCSRGLHNIGSMRFVKPAEINWSLKSDGISVSNTTRFLVGRRSVGRRPVDFRQKPSVNVRCLEMLPTTSGVNSALHSIFGRRNSNGVYNLDDENITKLRQSLATFIRDNKNKAKVSGFIKQFVLRVQKSDALDCPVASDVKVAYFKFQRTNSEQSEFNWQNATEFEDLFEEYAKFVEKPSTPVASAEVEMLIIIRKFSIHIYSDQSSSFKYKETFKPQRSFPCSYILHKRNGEFQRVEPNLKMEDFCKIDDDELFECPPIQSTYFQKFLDSLENHGANKQVIASMKKLNPEYGDTPDKLFELLLKYCQRNKETQEDFDVKLIDEYSTDFCRLAEWIEEHNCRNISSIIYLNIVKNYSPFEWQKHFLMFEICDRITQYDIRNIPRIKNCVHTIADKMPSMVNLLRKLVATSDSCSVLQPQNLLRLLALVSTDIEQGDGIVSQQLPELQLLPLNDWFYHLKSKMWENKVNQLPVSDSSIPKANKKLRNQAVYMLLELEFKNDENVCDDLLEKTKNLETAVLDLQKALYPVANLSKEYDERYIDDIINMMEEDMPLDEERFVKSKEYHKTLADVKTKIKESKLKFDKTSESGEQEYKLTEKRIKKLIKQWQKNGLELNDKSVVDFLCVYDCAVQKTCTKEGDQQIFQLRDTQRVAIMTLLTSKKKSTLVQVSTGEGKSLIVTGVAIAFALCRNKDNKKKKIDVITSNDVLARRDSMMSVADGGLRDLYEYFYVGVANNCSQWVDERIEAYNAAVVYGQLASFQRDYLLDEFYGHNIRGDRTMDLVIVDEVDCMLLDRGSIALYLSHDIPGMEMLESLYVFIWEKIHSSSIGSDKLAVRESVKAAVLYDLYGAITKNHLESISDSLKDKPSEKNELWYHLIETNVIDSEGRLLMENDIENIKFKNEMDPKIIFYLRTVANRKRNIQIPTHLMPFVELHVDTLLDNAMKALELQRDEDYVVDQDRTDNSPDLNPQVIIIDKDTGVDEISSQWDGALHQFIQLKEGCKLTSQCLKAIFSFTAHYILAYEKTLGVSGTLGSGPEQEFMQRSYKSTHFVIPTAFQKRFYLKPTKIFKSKDHWLHAMVKETRKIILPEDQAKARSLVIFCQSIKDVNIVHSYLKNALKSELNDNHIHCYTRGYEKFAFEGKSLEVGHVIIATNLAGRGTDIKISEQLKKNGGLHICLTFLPKNERIEEQAMGRTARNGAPGSGIFLLYEETSTGKKWGAGKWLSMKQERHWKESLQISCLRTDLRKVDVESEYMAELLDYYTEVTRKLKEQKRQDREIKIISDCVLDKWALWLDEYGDPSKLPRYSGFRTKLGLPESNTEDCNWMTPFRSLAMAKHLAMQRSSQSQSTAIEILNRVIASNDSSLYPAAHYYLAFILIQEDFKENKTNFIQNLQRCEAMLNNHIDMHLSFYRKVAHVTPEQTPTFCVVDAYKQQKNNVVKILEYFIGSVRALLGTHYCSASNLREAGRSGPEKLGIVKMKKKEVETFIQKKRSPYVAHFQKERKLNGEPKRHKISREKADELFQSLVQSRCITCQLNDIPNREAIVQQVANEYGIPSLISNLKSVFGKELTEEQIEKSLKIGNLIPCTRKAFWKELENARALEVVKDGLCPKMKCVVVLESECDVEPSEPDRKILNRENRIKIEFGLNSFDQNCLNVLYNPIYDNMNDLLKQKKIMFDKDYVIEQLGDEYCHRKENFEFNRIAQLNLDTLEKKSNDLSFSYSLGKNDLRRVNITSTSEQEDVWKALVEQKIIDSYGKLSSNYQKFSYPACPAYEEPVMRLIGRNFVAEIVKRQWLRLKADKDPSCLKAIDLLPLKPYRDMLGDLMAAHVISGARVTEDTKLIEEKTMELEDADERKCVRKFLKSHQAVYAPEMIKSDVFLDLIEMDIRKIPNTKNISMELYAFDLAGFNHVMDVKDRDVSWKTYLGAIFAGAAGIASASAGIFLIHEKLLSFGLSKNLLLMGGVSDILYAITTILTRSNFTWANYTRQRIMSAIGKTELMDTIKTIFKIYSSTANADSREAIRLAVGKERWKRRRECQIESEVASGGTPGRIELKSHKTEFFFHIQVHYLLQEFGKDVLREIQTWLAKNMTEIRKRLIQFNELHGIGTSQVFVRKKLNELISGIGEKDGKGHKWVSDITDAMTLIIPQQTAGSLLTQEIADEAIRKMESVFHDCEVRMGLMHGTVTGIRKFLSDLENHDERIVPTAEDIDVEEAFKRFQKRTLANIEDELKRQVEKILDLLRQQIHQVASNQVSNLANINSEIFATFLQLA
ncbi:LOW QUALITY PROTEIN: uncharacterized protein LOC130700691 [Daphnia carinata]|uniref:LOW QUALITY PROTEIN: uncharacterized protein LOC130700691 n=1 Tax=Daphnia carinata TaxID=120202 RepID=UPI002868B45D|nr:LOW QUALITY PROTEIN: uncharacterized protein LOC130700691 [Daphnia carinata]